MAKKRKIKFSFVYAVFPVLLIVLLMFSYFFLVNVPQNSKENFLQITLRSWHIQNSLKEFFVEDDYVYEMSKSDNLEDMNIRFKDVLKNRIEKGKLYANELSILRKNCEENKVCRKSEFGLLAINNLEGFADAAKNADLSLAEIYYNNATDFLRLFKYDLLRFKGKLDNLDLSRIVALGNADLLIRKKYIEINNYCKNVKEELRNEELFLKYCGNQIMIEEVSNKTCYTEKNLSGDKECLRSKEYIKQF